jgi:metal-responsive CopG/Arc/MetJ family transcriptional regulator
MEAIHVVIGKELLECVDGVARRAKTNRSALIREALREHLLKLEIRATEELDREGHAKRPQTRDEWEPWEAVASWPEE